MPNYDYVSHRYVGCSVCESECGFCFRWGVIERILLYCCFMYTSTYVSFTILLPSWFRCFAALSKSFSKTQIVITIWHQNKWQCTTHIDSCQCYKYKPILAAEPLMFGCFVFRYNSTLGQCRLIHFYHWIRTSPNHVSLLYVRFIWPMPLTHLWDIPVHKQWLLLSMKYGMANEHMIIRFMLRNEFIWLFFCTCHHLF